MPCVSPPDTVFLTDGKFAMKNFDMSLLHSLAAVIDQGSFNSAAQTLDISQSALSQRIASLEDAIGIPLVVRCRPVKPTKAGEKLMLYAQRVTHLSHEIRAELDSVLKSSTKQDLPVRSPCTEHVLQQS
jgi:DNA-binding transcriptional LysR family regulator